MDLSNMKYDLYDAIHYVPTGSGCGYYKVTLPNGSILTGDTHAEVMHDLMCIMNGETDA